MRHSATLLRLTGWIIPFSLAAMFHASGETRHWNSHRGFSPFSETESPTLQLDNRSSLPSAHTVRLTAPSSVVTFSFRAANRHSHPLRRHSYTTAEGDRRSVLSPGWSIIATGVRGDTLRLTLRSKESEEAGDGVSTTRAVGITAEYRGYKGTSATADSNPYFHAPALNPDTGWNSLRLTADNGFIKLYGGTRQLSPILSLETPLSDISSIGFEPMPATLLEVDCISLESPDPMPRCPRLDPYSPESLLRLRHLAAESRDELEGEWVVYDRSLEETSLRSGGDYRLLMVSTAEGYDLLYLSGARVCPARWSPGMVKARMSATPLSGVWKVTWYDAEGEPLAHDTRAQYDNTSSLLTLMFPYSGSSLRLYPVRE